MTEGLHKAKLLRGNSEEFFYILTLLLCSFLSTNFAKEFALPVANFMAQRISGLFCKSGF